MEWPRPNIADLVPRRSKIDDLNAPYRSRSIYVVVVGTLLAAMLTAFAVITSKSFVVPSVAPTIFIIVAFPLSYQAHPRNILYSTAISILAGVAALALFNLIDVPPDLTDLSWARAGALVLAFMVAMCGMIALRALHAPALATAMIIAAGLLKAPGDWLAAFVGVLIVTVAGVAVNRASGKPQALWWRPQPPGE